jgi:hypothetical protein
MAPLTLFCRLGNARRHSKSGEREGKEPKGRGLALKGGKGPANPPGFHAIPAWYREMQIYQPLLRS